ncbi:MAG: hypothetical protein Q8R53_03515 [Nanoarchaeota archaeon]|nr:hypothetical protein [Nanoarchaeota archaeon]
MEQEKLTIGQRILLFFLYGLVALMVVFSLLAMKDKNFAGYEKCIQEKCDRKGEAFCNKLREVSNCCLGAGGQVAMAGSEYTCVFEK